MEEVVKEIGQEIKYEWKHWHYKNTALLIASLVLFFIFAEHPLIKDAIAFIGNFGYISAFFIGILFVSVFTIAPSAVVLYYLAETLNPFYVALIAGMGGVVGDYLILRLLKDRIFDELKPLFFQTGIPFIKKLFKTPHFSWAVPILGAVIVASPLPDELGIGLLGASKMTSFQFVLLTFLLDTLGIFFIIVLARYF